MAEKKKYSNIILVDYSWCLHRFYWANKDLYVERKGKTIKTGTLFGFSYFTERVLSSYPNAAIVYCMDSKSKNRKEISEDYKAQRQANEEVHVSTPHIMNLLSLVPNVFFAKVWETEADDILACLALQNKKNNPNQNLIVHTGDNDLFQLLKYGVVVSNEFKNGRFNKIGEQDVYKKYGVFPKTLLKFRVLEGDTSDNIKGVVPGMRKNFLRSLAETWEEEGDILKACTMLQEKEPKKVKLILDNIDKVQQNMELMNLEKYKDNGFPIKLKRYSSSDSDKMIKYYELNRYKNFLEKNGWL